MEPETAEVEVQARSAQDERNAAGIAEVRSGPHNTGGIHRNTGPGSYWIRPWLKNTNSSMCPYHCDGFDLRMV